MHDAALGIAMEPGRFVEDYDPDDCVDQQYYDGYADLTVHRLMLMDVSRMSFYREAITQGEGMRGKIVVDVGSGTGILTMWASRAGAKHVFSIEASSLSSVQAQVIADNGMSSKVTVLEDTVERIIARGVEDFVSRYREVLSGSGVSVLLSEWMGFYLLHEGMLPSLIRARDFFAEVNVALGVSQVIEMIPAHAAIYVAPITCKPYHAQHYQTFWRDVDGFDFSRYGQMEFLSRLEQASPLIECLPATCILHESVPLAELDLNVVRKENIVSLRRTVHFNFRSSAVFRHHIANAGENSRVAVDGFTVWFDVASRGLVLSTSPYAAPTHWKQTTILLPLEVRSAESVAFSVDDEELSVDMHICASDDTLRSYTLELELM